MPESLPKCLGWFGGGGRWPAVRIRIAGRVGAQRGEGNSFLCEMQTWVDPVGMVGGYDGGE
jgi:hypothetical protein